MQAAARRLDVYSSLLSTVVFRRRLFTAVVLTSLAAGPPARAGEGEATTVSAAEFLARVGKSHPGLELLEAAVDDAAAGVRAAGRWPNPSLSYDREEVFAAGGGLPENTLRLEVPVELSGRRGLRVEGAKLGVDAARAASVRGRDELLFEAMELYWSGARARQGLELLRQERQGLAAGERVVVKGAYEIKLTAASGVIPRHGHVH